MKLADIRARVQPEHIRLDPQLLATLTGDSITVADCLDAAARWAYAKLKRCRVDSLDDDDLEVLTEALRKRTVYELFTGGEVEADAEDKRRDAEGLLTALVGDCAGSDTKKPHVGGAVTRDATLSDHLALRS